MWDWDALREAIQTLDRALSLANSSGLKKEEADCQKAKGSALVQLGKYGEALEWYRQARQTYDLAGLNAEPEFKQQLIEALGDLGNLEVRLGDTASAEKIFDARSKSLRQSNIREELRST